MDQRYTKFDAIRELGSVKLNSKASSEARVDRVFSEVHEIDTAAARPAHATAAVKLLGYEVGMAHPEDAFSFLVDAQLIGMNDTHELWQLLWKVDMKAWVTAAGGGLVFPNVLVKDRWSLSDQYGTAGTSHTWVFDVINPDNYVQPAQDGSVVHPIDGDAVLVYESMSRGGIEGRVTRRYQKLPELVDWTFDPETGDPIKTVRQIVASVAVPSTPDPGVDVSQRALGTGFSLRVTTSMNPGGDGMPTDYDYRDFIDYTFPRLLSDVQVLTLDAEYRFNPVLRSPLPKKVVARVSITFHDSNPSPSAVYQLYPADWNYNGFTITVPELQNIITDEWDFAVLSSSSVEVFVGQASDPTYTEYVADIGEEKLIVERCTPWKFRLWRRMRIYITLE